MVGHPGTQQQTSPKSFPVGVTLRGVQETMRAEGQGLEELEGILSQKSTEAWSHRATWQFPCWECN